MENPSGIFFFSAQQPTISSMDMESGKDGEINSTSKQARAEHDVLGRNDVGVANGMGSFKSKLMSMSPPKHWQLTDPGDGYFVARFQMKEDLDYVLTSGPWVIAKKYLVVQRWKPNFMPGEESIQSMLIWVRLSELPVEWIDLDLLWNI
ncbi:hypothetical protein Dsin_024529 [Dipteronia sinensis]|uniref:DUF4283 domain-containing protein n=1 Tax=Dipteronia sinensis TaxID=43782 RepID=A0AAE0DXH2_9ROSI|nr:hypothetical protein Dsin_024529 [Dipteronia sinensis]